MQRHRRRRPSDRCPWRRRPPEPDLLHATKVGALSVRGSDEVKQTNEIGMVIPLLEPLDIAVLYHPHRRPADPTQTRRLPR
jgi:hypothetical protein